MKVAENHFIPMLLKKVAYLLAAKHYNFFSKTPLFLKDRDCLIWCSNVKFYSKEIKFFTLKKTSINILLLCILLFKSLKATTLTKFSWLIKYKTTASEQ